MTPYIIELRPEDAAIANELKAELKDKFFPAIDEANSREEWRKAMDATHNRTEVFWNAMKAKYPINGLACGLSDNEHGKPCIIVQGTLKAIKDAMLKGGLIGVSEVSGRIMNGLKNGFL